MTLEWVTVLYAFFTHVDEEQIRGKGAVSACWAVPRFVSRHLKIYKVNRRRICVKLFWQKESTKSSLYLEEIFLPLLSKLRRRGAKWLQPWRNLITFVLTRYWRTVRGRGRMSMVHPQGSTTAGAPAAARWHHAGPTRRPLIQAPKKQTLLQPPRTSNTNPSGSTGLRPASVPCTKRVCSEFTPAPCILWLPSEAKRRDSCIPGSHSCCSRSQSNSRALPWPLGSRWSTGSDLGWWFPELESMEVSSSYKKSPAMSIWSHKNPTFTTFITNNLNKISHLVFI